MRKVAVQVGLVIGVIALAAGAPATARQQNPGGHMDLDPFRAPRAPLGKAVKPSINLLIGTWKLNVEASRFENTAPPAEATRVYKDLGNGSYSYTQISVSPEGSSSETQYIGKDDGTESPLMRVGADKTPMPTGVTIAFRWVNARMAEQTQIDHGVVAMLTREISPDGKFMTVTLPTNPYFYVHQHADDPAPDIIVFERQQ